jgi:hypothetical protein
MSLDALTELMEFKVASFLGLKIIRMIDSLLNPSITLNSYHATPSHLGDDGIRAKVISFENRGGKAALEERKPAIRADPLNSTGIIRLWSYFPNFAA